MNSLVNMDRNVQQMTSLEIAELVGTEHRNVKVSIDRLIKKGVNSGKKLSQMAE